MSELVFEWDEAKRRLVLEKHRIDLVDAVAVFAGPKLVYASPRGGEDRWVAIGYVQGRCIAVAFTRRGQAIRIITARRARDNEQRDFDANVIG